MLSQSYFGKCLSLVFFRPAIKSCKDSLDLQTKFCTKLYEKSCACLIVYTSNYKHLNGDAAIRKCIESKF